MMAGLGYTSPMILGIFAGVPGFLAQFANRRGLGRSVARVDHAAGNLQFDRFGPVPELLDHHQLLVRREGDHVHPVDAIDDVEIVLLVGAR